MTTIYRPTAGVDAFESRDRRRLLVFSRRTGELMLLVDRSVELWRALSGASPIALEPADTLVLEALRRRGFVDAQVGAP